VRIDSHCTPTQVSVSRVCVRECVSVRATERSFFFQSAMPLNPTLFNLDGAGPKRPSCVYIVHVTIPRIARDALWTIDKTRAKDRAIQFNRLIVLELRADSLRNVARIPIFTSDQTAFGVSHKCRWALIPNPLCILRVCTYVDACIMCEI